MLKIRASQTFSDDEYKEMAPLYDTLAGPFLSPIRREVNRVVRKYGFRKVVDLCCGTGEQSILLDQLGIEVKGVDISPSMLRVATEKSPHRIEYFLEDATKLHFEDHSFDCAVISFALHEKDFRSRSLILNEAKRILVQEGKILIVDFIEPRGFFPFLSHLFIRCVERMAGKGHYSHFNEYMKRGALRNLLEEHHLIPTYRKTFYADAIALVLANKQIG